MPDFPEVELTGLTELRIHGVSGTPAESMLGHPHPLQVTGDRLAGCYRRADHHGDPHEVPAPSRTHLEAYSWGGLTAGAAARAFWLLLLPFMLVNVASWTHPPRAGRRFPPVGAMSGAIRVLALSMTGTIVVGAAGVGMDALAWQCATAADTCGSKHFFTRFLTSGYFAQPGPRIAVGALIPLAVIGALALLSRGTSRSYEDYQLRVWKSRPAAAEDDVPFGARDLAQQRFWQGGRPFARLRSTHVGAALAAIGGLVAFAAAKDDPSGWRWLGVAVAISAAVVIAVAVALVASPLAGRRRELFEGRPPAPALSSLMRFGQWIGAIVLGAAFVYAFALTERPASPGILPGLHRTTDLLMYVQLATLAVLLVTTYWAVRVCRPDGESLRGQMFGGFGAVVLGLLGLALLAAYVAGAAFRIADYVGRPVQSDCLPECADGIRDTVIGLQPQYFWAARGLTVGTIAAVVVGLLAWLRLRKPSARTLDLVRAEYGDTADDPDRLRAIAKVHQSAGLSDIGHLLFLAIVGVTVVTVGVLWLVQADRTPYGLPILTTVGTWLAGAFAIGVLGVGRLAYRNPQLRRTVGILWDLGTFWPRACHPFAPPCYCERTVPEIARRIEQVTTSGGEVVISAHSQGTVIAAATVWQLSPEALRRTALVTYGSPLERFYSRLFPHYFGLSVHRAELARLSGRWRNLYRRSDPIGGPLLATDADVESSPIDRRLHDPEFDMPEYSFTWPRSRGHSDYPDDPRFGEVVEELAGTLVVRLDGENVGKAKDSTMSR